MNWGYLALGMMFCCDQKKIVGVWFIDLSEVGWAEHREAQRLICVGLHSSAQPTVLFS